MRHRDYSNPVPFRDELLQVFIPRMYYNYRIERRPYYEPAATLFTSATRKSVIPPPPVRLSWDSRHPPPESARTDGWTYADVRTKIFRINGLPNFLTHGAPRAPLINPTTELVFCFIEALLADPQWKKVQCSYSHSEFDPRGILITSRTSFSRGLFMSQDPRGRSCHCLFQLYGKKNWKKTLSARTRRKVNYLIL